MHVDLHCMYIGMYACVYEDYESFEVFDNLVRRALLLKPLYKSVFTSLLLI